MVRTDLTHSCCLILLTMVLLAPCILPLSSMLTRLITSLGLAGPGLVSGVLACSNPGLDTEEKLSHPMKILFLGTWRPQTWALVASREPSSWVGVLRRMP